MADDPVAHTAPGLNHVVMVVVGRGAIAEPVALDGYVIGTVRAHDVAWGAIAVVGEIAVFYHDVMGTFIDPYAVARHIDPAQGDEIVPEVPVAGLRRAGAINDNVIASRASTRRHHVRGNRAAQAHHGPRSDLCRSRSPVTRGIKERNGPGIGARRPVARPGGTLRQVDIARGGLALLPIDRYFF